MSNLHLYISALTAGLTAALFGYSVSFIGGVLVLPSFLTHFHLSNLSSSALAIAQSRIVSVWLIGALCGVPLGMPVCSRLGRKWCLLFSALLYVLGAGLQLLDLDLGGGYGDIRIFEVGRVLNGLGVGVGTLVSPMYISEISPPSERGMLMSGYQAILQFSALVGFWGAYASNAIFPSSSSLQWQVPVAIQLLPGVFLLFGTLYLPESPRFLAEKSRESESEKALVWLRGAKKGQEWKVGEEMVEVRDAAEVSRRLGERNVSFLSEICKRSVRKRLIIGVGLMIAQNMVGLNALNYYAPVISMSAGFTSVSSSLFLTGIFGVVKLLSALLFMFVLVKLRSNRFWLKLGSLICGISMLILAYFVRALPTPSTDPASALQSINSLHIISPPQISSLNTTQNPLTLNGLISVLTIYAFAFSFAISLGPISWNICSEIFPLHLNARCCAITTCTQWTFQIVIAALTPRLLAKVGWGTYVVYAAFCGMTALWIQWGVPETRGVKLGREMDGVFGDEVEGIEEEEEVVETTALLGRAGSGRRGSLGAYT